MRQHLYSELKKEFQLERMILFSDAVFAIAITLLVLEIKVPEIDRNTATDELLLARLNELLPKFVGFLLSFYFIGLYWTIHHRMFGYVVNYSRRLLWLNLFFLLAVVLMPFSSAFYSEYIFRLLKTPLVIYAGNVIFLGITNLLLWTYLTNPKHGLVEGLPGEEKKYFFFRALLVPVVFLLVTIAYLFVNRIAAVYIPLLIPLLIRMIKKRRDKPKQKKIHETTA
jgi:uncharacterized membrane protein